MKFLYVFSSMFIMSSSFAIQYTSTTFNDCFDWDGTNNSSISYVDAGPCLETFAKFEEVSPTIELERIQEARFEKDESLALQEDKLILNFLSQNFMDDDWQLYWSWWCREIRNGTEGVYFDENYQGHRYCNTKY